MTPTPCDDWCEATSKVPCMVWTDDPASCVAHCEQVEIPTQSKCVPLFAAWTKCIKNTPPSEICDATVNPCAYTYNSLQLCSELPATE